MAFRIQFQSSVRVNLQQIRQAVDRVVPDLVRESLETVRQQAARHLSGSPFTSRTGSHTIRGNGDAVQSQYPNGTPNQGRVFTSRIVQYPGNPERYDVLKVLEFGHGEIRPKYTPSMRAGRPDRARLAIPDGPNELTTGQFGFRGVTGRYKFVKSIPAKEGKYWMESAAIAARPRVRSVVESRLRSLLQ